MFEPRAALTRVRDVWLGAKLEERGPVIGFVGAVSNYKLSLWLRFESAFTANQELL